MNGVDLAKLIQRVLSENKADDICVLDVHKHTIITDVMLIASGTSRRHNAALAEKVLYELKQRNVLPLGVEGENPGDWVLIDLGDVVVHLMHPETRVYYQLEKLWGMDESATAGSGNLSLSGKT